MAKYDEPNYKAAIADQVLHLQIDRPRKLNAFDEQMWRSLRRLVETASDDPDVHCVVLSSTIPKAFTSGLDLGGGGLMEVMGQATDPARAAHAMRDHIRDFQAAITSLAKCRKPVVACLNGLSLGLAVDLATACDVRLCSADTKFSVREVEIGLAADIGTLQRLQKCVGNHSWVREVCLTARFFDAKEALAQGLVSAVHDTHAAAVEAGLKLGAVIASKSPIAVQATKFLLEYSRDRTVDEGLLVTQLWNASQLQAADVPEAMSAVMAKRKPTFEKL